MLKSNQKEVMQPKIVLDKVNLLYEKSSTISIIKRNSTKTRKSFHALKDVSFSISEGETIGIIGRNGSGKSTIARVISNIFTPTSGSIEVVGKVQLLALGVGFNPKLTGRDNVYISGSLLGMSRKDITECIGEIEEFTELGEFFDEPVRTYSNGMKSRLGFAVSTIVEPDILILDEVMSTGDQAFRIKAEKRMEEMRERTKIVVIVSHNPGQVKEMCSRVIWLDKGKLILDGEPEMVLQHYNKFCNKPGQWKKENPLLGEIIDS